MLYIIQGLFCYRTVQNKNIEPLSTHYAEHWWLSFSNIHNVSHGLHNSHAHEADICLCPYIRVCMCSGQSNGLFPYSISIIKVIQTASFSEPQQYSYYIFTLLKLGKSETGERKMDFSPSFPIIYISSAYISLSGTWSQNLDLEQVVLNIF